MEQRNKMARNVKKKKKSKLQSSILKEDSPFGVHIMPINLQREVNIRPIMQSLTT